MVLGNVASSEEERPQRRIALLLCFCGLLYLFNVLVLVEKDLLHVPPEAGDGPDYENIAFNLSRGAGVGFDWSDPEWQRPYRENNENGQFDGLLARHGKFFLTTQRPPLYPVVLSVTFSVFGRSFAVVRCLNLLFSSREWELSWRLSFDRWARLRHSFLQYWF